ncbi:hypothetical cytosolic protein [Syntrophus aciditrophicus SB]|uniref:Hypothetical cytosolic protein n=2 Tax=Syntrophus TaxID=43773 RepID=Q2LQP8_SYNAS|nr:hypothetical cytosolic protein [Syntrophus aciditrophicus SB]
MTGCGQWRDKMEFSSLLEAFAVYHREPEGSRAYLDAIAYILRSVPPEIKEEFYRIVFSHFPELKPDYYDKEGNPLYDLDHACEFLGLSDEDKERFIEWAQDQQGIFADPERLHKIQ